MTVIYSTMNSIRHGTGPPFYHPQQANLQGVCVWCMTPLSARVGAPGTPPWAATRAAVTTIAIVHRQVHTLGSSFTESFFLWRVLVYVGSRPLLLSIEHFG